MADGTAEPIMRVGEWAFDLLLKVPYPAWSGLAFGCENRREIYKKIGYTQILESYKDGEQHTQIVSSQI